MGAEHLLVEPNRLYAAETAAWGGGKEKKGKTETAEDKMIKELYRIGKRNIKKNAGIV